MSAFFRSNKFNFPFQFFSKSDQLALRLLRVEGPHLVRTKLAVAAIEDFEDHLSPPAALWPSVWRSS
jgi:hypothetical protein